MQVIRTIVWVIVLVALIVFSLANWTPVMIHIWGGLVWETKLPALVVIAFLLGLVPMWLLHKAGRWRLKRQIKSLQAVAQNTASLSSTQLEQEAQFAADTTITPN